MNGTKRIFGLVAAIALIAGAASGALQPKQLECEFRESPLGIDALKPRLSWVLPSDDRATRGQAQAAYRLLVASSEKLLKQDVGDLWDSGKVVSDQSVLVEYSGQPLVSRQQCWWKVRVWDGREKGSVWSAPATWTMGLLRPDDWKPARWIGSGQMATSAPPLFRREFDVAKRIRRATLFVCGLGHYELRLNGERVGDRVIDPGWTDYRDTCLYSTYDVTKRLTRGPNAIGVMLGNGMYNVVGGRYVKFRGSFGPPKLILQLEVEHTDGTFTIVGSDGAWKTARGPITFSCTYGGEDYDARRELLGWDAPRFDDSAWQAAQYTDGPGGTLRSQTAPPIKVAEEFSTVRVTEPKPGIFVYDIGQNFSGWPKLSVRGPAGATVKMIPGELLGTNGLVSQQSSGGPVSFSYTLRGDGVETWVPRFSYYGFRYVQVEGAVPTDSSKFKVQGSRFKVSSTSNTGTSNPELRTSNLELSTSPRIVELKGQWLHSSAPVVGEFECSNPLINRIHRLILAAIRCNLQSVLTDCPHREKLGWLEVSHLLGRGVMFNYHVPTFYAKVSQDMREAQLENGLVPDIAPEYTVFSGGFRDSPEWGSASVFNPWLVREFYADRSLLERHFDVMSRYVAYLGSTATNHIVAHGLGDWYDIGPRGPGPSQLTSFGLTATAIYYGDLTILADTARMLGKAEDAARYDKLAGEVRAAFDARFFHRDTRQYDTGSQTAQAMPLVLGLAEKDQQAAVLETLVRSIVTNGNRVTAGDVGFMYVVRALTDAGRSDILYDMVCQTNGPGYYDQLRKGATTLTEAWDANPHSSQNHCMLGHAEEWFYAGLAGIRPDPSAPGFKRFVIKPAVVGDLTWVKAHHDSPYGRISSGWKKTGNRFTLDVAVPPNTTATIYIPTKDYAETIHESGKPVAKVRGLRILRSENGAAVFEAGSGHYQFSSELPLRRLDK